MLQNAEADSSVTIESNGIAFPASSSQGINNSAGAETDHGFLSIQNHPACIPNKKIIRSSENHFQKAFTRLNDMRKCGQLCDVTLVVNGLEIPAHRAILASSSPYFSAMFTSCLSEANQEKIEMHGLDSEALGELVEFMYTSEVHVTEETVQQLLPAANLLQLDEVQEVCCEFLQSQLHPSNCLGIQRFADLHHCTELLIYARQYAEQHFDEVLKYEEEFLALEEKELDLLLSSDRLAVTEDDLLESVIRWVEHDLKNRAILSGPRLIRRVRYPFLSIDYLIRITSSHPTSSSSCNANHAIGGGISNNSSSSSLSSRLSSSGCSWCHDYLIEAMRFHLMSNEEKHSLMCSHAAVAQHAASSTTTTSSSYHENLSSLETESEHATRSTMKEEETLSEIYRPRIPIKIFKLIGGPAPKLETSVHHYVFTNGVKMKVTRTTFEQTYSLDGTT